MNRGWTVEEVADRLLVSPSKVSRLETGQRGVSARDVRDLCDLYEVDAEQRRRLTELAAAGKERAWWQGRDLPYSTYIGLEAEAISIRDFGLGLVPGLLQTADYAQAVLKAFVPHHPAEIIQQRVETRMARQQRVLSGEAPPEFRAILEVAVLHRVVGSQPVMQAQLERLLELSLAPNIDIRVVPYAAGALPVANNKFIILSFADTSLSDVVFIEGLTGDLYVESDEDVEIYHAAFSELAAMAESPAATRQIIESILGSCR